MPHGYSSLRGTTVVCLFCCTQFSWGEEGLLLSEDTAVNVVEYDMHLKALHFLQLFLIGVEHLLYGTQKKGVTASSFLMTDQMCRRVSKIVK